MQMNEISVPESNVRRNTIAAQNQKIDELTLQNIEQYSNQPDTVISQHLHDLDKKWDIERTLEVNMATIALTGIALSAIVSKKWLYLPAVVLGFFVQHAVQGWCPSLLVFRGLKVRHRSEIDQEKYALKALRGDFTSVTNADEALKAVQKY